MGWSTAFGDFPVLETERFTLRALELTDAPSLFRYFSKEEVTEFYDVELLTSEQQAVEMIQGLLYRYKERKQIRWGIQAKGQHEIIGSCGFHELEFEHSKAEIGYELHPDYWGKSVMTEVVQRVIHYGFSEIGLNRIEAFFEPLNSRSRKVLEKNGFKFEGVLRKRFLVKGKYVDAAVAAILRDDFFKGSN